MCVCVSEVGGGVSPEVGDNIQEKAEGRKGVHNCAASCFVNCILQPFGVRLGQKDEGTRGERMG